MCSALTTEHKNPTASLYVNGKCLEIGGQVVLIEAARTAKNSTHVHVEINQNDVSILSFHLVLDYTR